MYNGEFRQAKPFVKWVGGKTQLIKDIESILPKNFFDKDITYVEPFVGGGAVLFWILQKFSNIKKAVINDINPKLIITYKVVKQSPKELIALLKDFQKEYISLSEEERKTYYLNKRERYNSSLLAPIETAAMFIFLNRTCFNGLYRVNSKGRFNVPHGRYSNPKICDEQTILADSEILQRVEIICGDFSETFVCASENTLFYLDPPYRPLSKTSSFNSYAKEKFDDKEQLRLCEFCQKLSDRGVNFILSNSDSPNDNNADSFFENIYNGYKIKRVFASRRVNSIGNRRGELTELMISNI